ncbi:MAG TPA: NF038122 family metalloprotease [Phenylobacterium sp.]
MTFKNVLCVGVAAASLTAGAANAATINLIDLGGVTGSPAEQGFKVAANFWGSLFTNTATINLGVKFAPLPPNVIGSTGSRRADLSIATYENRINATKSSSAIDSAVVLPDLSAGGIQGLTVGVNGSGNNDTAVTAVLDGSQRASQILYANSAVIKAIGGPLASPNQLDGSVTFSSTFGFDFNPRNGIDAGTFDFIGVAIHEIGHALGFVSGVDFFDYYGYPNGPGRGALGYDLNDTSIFSALDMFRYSAPGTLDFRTGGTKYFSIDGGATALFGNTFATGQFNGDGRQASHWKDTPGCQIGNGIMDPTFCFGQTGFVTGLDLAAFDAMGWNLNVNALKYRTTSTGNILKAYLGAVPEPSTWTTMIMGFGLAGAMMRRRRFAAAKIG